MPGQRSRRQWIGGAALLAASLVGCETPAPVSPTEPPPPPAATAPAAPIGQSSAPPSGLTSVDDKALDPGVSPCNDFYQYACGGWLKSTPIPGDEASWTRSFNVMAERNEGELRAILERYASGQGKDEPDAQKLGDYYASCMDEATIEKAGIAALKPELDRIDKIRTVKDLAEAIGALHARDVHPVFHFASGQDARDATQVIGILYQGGLGLPDRDYYLKDDELTKKLREKYEEHVGKMFELLGDKPAAAKQGAATVLSVERVLAEASMSKEDQRDPQKIYHRLERAGLEQAAPTFPWGSYLAKLGAPGVTAINVAQPEFVKAIDVAVSTSPLAACKDDGGKAAKPCPKPAKKFPAAEWKTYLRWHLVRAAARSLPARFVEESFRFEQTLTGIEKLPPRWKRCVRGADDALGEALAQPYVKKTLGAEGKATVKEMVLAIEQAMGENLKGLRWMDEETRGRAHAKLAAIANKIGYPDKWRDYTALAVVRGDYAGNRMRASAFEVKRDLGKIGKPVDRSEWGMTPPTVNAYYEPALNEMVFPAGILATPFFSSAATKATNYGAIGMVIGHELTHGFDDEGRQYDEKGNLRDWWTPAVNSEFNTRAACVEKQFNDYVAIDDLHLKGKLTLGENLADLGGMRLAYLALKKELAGKPREASAFSPEQQFFLGFAQGWCTSMRDETLRLLVKNNPHSPPRFRVNGPVSNMPEFAAAFQCKAGSPMVRANRCEVW
jgi:putative endopeptidase